MPWADPMSRTFGIDPLQRACGGKVHHSVKTLCHLFLAQRHGDKMGRTVKLFREF
ncbi:MAG: hypothetical protein NT027_14745 [Proteobacteria bacterium]|nr:hypothetical protein [Pseudomonadota bacterium]